MRERLRFPSGFSTAVLIGVLHGQTKAPSSGQDAALTASGAFASLVPDSRTATVPAQDRDRPESDLSDAGAPDVAPAELRQSSPEGPTTKEWAADLRLLLGCFGLSGLYTLCTYFLPFLRNVPIFGLTAASTWLWTLNPSLAYVGQGIIMGPETTLHMLLGAVIGWAALSPLARHKGWAPGPVDDWEEGSKGWIVWISLAIMLADALVNLGYLALRTLFRDTFPTHVSSLKSQVLKLAQSFQGRSHQGYSPLGVDEDEVRDPVSSQRSDGVQTLLIPRTESGRGDQETDLDDAPAEQQIGNRAVCLGLLMSVFLCITTVHAVFGDLVPLYANVVAVLVALVLSIMGVRALGETDLNPVSGISKLAQLFFAFIIPKHSKEGVLINLVAGAVVRHEGSCRIGTLLKFAHSQKP